ncbi:DeoR/GlpR family DNA-binding transcription regulator [Bacillus taeanensis]|uniref:DeoR family transcriptional regulator n=1 Tax=Bacillus taeanensis TaxID=273032 RepID=A0A366XZH6_9BACI|nr:DeoR/GlpR family DNA-binding transcription regulator [Bacillus taeanensis]RBW69553.1 DeoR family transcriptional regulator [Bacillus taeanensis]
MLTPERHRIILEILEEKQIVKLHDLVEATSSSESTIRRDLVQLESQRLLKRVHGGASLLQKNRIEPSISEKSTKHLNEKQLIAKYAAKLVRDGDSIFLDAGTTTMQMIESLNQRDITVVTNGLTLIEPLLEKNIETYLIGGSIKGKTRALIGHSALKTLENYRFDKAFMGMNSVHSEYGYTTPDPEEALIKNTAMSLAKKAYVLIDQSKFGEVSFAKVADLNQAVIITTEPHEDLIEYKRKAEVIIVNE